MCYGTVPESHGQNLGLTGVCMPYLLDIGGIEPARFNVNLPGESRVVQGCMVTGVGFRFRDERAGFMVKSSWSRA